MKSWDLLGIFYKNKKDTVSLWKRELSQKYLPSCESHWKKLLRKHIIMQKRAQIEPRLLKLEKTIYNIWEVYRREEQRRQCSQFKKSNSLVTSTICSSWKREVSTRLAAWIGKKIWKIGLLLIYRRERRYWWNLSSCSRGRREMRSWCLTTTMIVWMR